MTRNFKDGSESTQKNSQKNDSIVNHEVPKNSGKGKTIQFEKPLVNIRGAFSDDYRTYREFEMTVSYDLIRNLVIENKASSNNQDETQHHLYKEAVYLFFKPMSDPNDVKMSLVKYVCIREYLHDEILKNQNGNFTLYAWIHLIDDAWSEIGASWYWQKPERKKNFVPFVNPVESDIVFTPHTITELIHINYFVFLMRMVEFIRKSGSVTYTFSHKKLWNFLDKNDEDLSHPVNACLEVLYYYNLINFDIVKLKNDSIRYKVSIVNMECYDSFFEKSENRKIA